MSNGKTKTSEWAAGQVQKHNKAPAALEEYVPAEVKVQEAVWCAIGAVTGEDGTVNQAVLEELVKYAKEGYMVVVYAMRHPASNEAVLEQLQESGVQCSWQPCHHPKREISYVEAIANGYKRSDVMGFIIEVMLDADPEALAAVDELSGGTVTTILCGGAQKGSKAVAAGASA